MKTNSLRFGVAFLAVLLTGCGNSTPLALDDTASAPELGVVDVASAAAMAYGSVGDCSQSTLVDPGRVRVVDGLTIIQGQIFDCPLSGDITGTIRVYWRNAVLGPGPEAGHVTGTTSLLIESFFGDSDVSGGFEGPFSASVADLLFGESALTRSGSGDFQGMVMQGTFFQDPPGSGRTVEAGTIIGR